MSENQSRIDSAMEAVTNTAIGFLVAMIGNAVILPWMFDIELSTGENAMTALAYTMISIIRQFTLRRMFNGRSVWTAIKAKMPCPACKGSGIVRTYNVVMGSFEDPCARCS